MKKLLYITISLLLLLTITACDIRDIDFDVVDEILENVKIDFIFPIGKDSSDNENSKNNQKVDKPQNESKDTDIDNSNENNTNNNDNTNNDNNDYNDNNGNNNNTDNNNNNNNNDTNNSNNNDNNDTNNNTDNNNNNNSNNSSNSEGESNDEILAGTSTETMLVPVNIQKLGTTNITEEDNAENITATAVLYTLDGNVVNWTSENDIIYIITEGNNRLVVIDSKNMRALYNAPLAGAPAEMNIIEDNIYISIPDLCRIDVFSKSNCQKESSLYFDTEVSSFCFDGDHIYYSEHDQWCKVFKKNLKTNVVTEVRTDNVYSYSEPKVFINKEDRILYIGERGSSGSGIYYFDADTLALKSVFKKDNYGIFNHTREIFHIGDTIFWGNYCLSDTNANHLIARYGTAAYGSVVFATEELVATYEGVFLTDTCECIVNYFDANFEFEYILVSSSYNVFFRMRSYVDGNIILGINFELQ